MRAATIGTGRISAEHLGFLQRSTLADLVAVCDLSPIAAAYHAEQFGAASHYMDYETMLREVQPDVVHVLTPPRTHCEIAGMCLRAGAHVICEKPLALTSQECGDLLSLAREHDRIVIEDQNYRFNEPVLELSRQIADGVLGDICEVDVRLSLPIRESGRYADPNLPHPSHSLPAGAIHEFITHLCYLVDHFLPGQTHETRSDEVTAQWRNRCGGDLFRYDDLEAVIARGDALGRIRFECRGKPNHFLITVYGTKVSAHVDLFSPCIRLQRHARQPEKLTSVLNQWCDGRTLKRAALRNLRDKIVQRTPYEGLHTFLYRSYMALTSNSLRPVTDEEMKRTMRLTELLLAQRPGLS